VSVIHNTASVTPGKLELLASWLPAQRWYRGTTPDLTRAGGFRLDDPAGRVGIEFMVVADGSVHYHAPMTYREAPLAGGEPGLIGTAEHSVLGKRWVYDGVHDPVFVDTLLALLRGTAEPQAQSRTDTPEPTVHARCPGIEGDAPAAGPITANGPEGTDIRVRTDLVLRVRRTLRDGGGTPDCLGEVSACWQQDGSTARDAFALLIAG
jgi:hypothetical protein